MCKEAGDLRAFCAHTGGSLIAGADNVRAVAYGFVNGDIVNGDRVAAAIICRR